MTTLEVLQEARRRLASPDSWCQYSYAMNAVGKHVTPVSPEATRWCLTGAVESVAQSPFFGEVPKECADALGVLCHCLSRSPPRMRGRAFGLVGWNDQPDRTHEEVLDLLDLAIAKQQNRPPGL